MKHNSTTMVYFCYIRGVADTYFDAESNKQQAA